MLGDQVLELWAIGWNGLLPPPIELMLVSFSFFLKAICYADPRWWLASNLVVFVQAINKESISFSDDFQIPNANQREQKVVSERLFPSPARVV